MKSNSLSFLASLSRLPPRLTTIPTLTHSHSNLSPHSYILFYFFNSSFSSHLFFFFFVGEACIVAATPAAGIIVSAKNPLCVCVCMCVFYYLFALPCFISSDCCLRIVFPIVPNVFLFRLCGLCVFPHYSRLCRRTHIAHARTRSR